MSENKCEKIFHNVTVKVFVKEEDNYENIEKSFLTLFPFDLKEGKVKVNKIQAHIVEERKMFILEVLLTRNRQINDFMKNIMSIISKKDKDLIIEQLDTRIDEESNFFFRIDKEKYVNDKEVVLTDDGSCFHFKVHVATYPQSIEKAKELLIDFFKEDN